mgnify:CR=1 FL=1
MALINYSGKSDIIKFARDMAVLALISKVLNEGWKPKMDGTDDRHYPYFYLSSGFVCCGAFYGNGRADTASASRLCLRSQELAKFAGEKFLPEYRDFIIC